MSHRIGEDGTIYNDGGSRNPSSPQNNGRKSNTWIIVASVIGAIVLIIAIIIGVSYSHKSVDTKTQVAPVASSPTSLNQSSKTPTTSGLLFNEEGIVFSDSNTRYLTRDEIREKAINTIHDEKTTLQFMINEIYARHGMQFTATININHYERYQWYRQLDKKSMESASYEFNDIETSNVHLIVSLMEEKGYR